VHTNLWGSGNNDESVQTSSTSSSSAHLGVLEVHSVQLNGRGLGYKISGSSSRVVATDPGL
jgi:hypothetical protein